MNPTSGRPTKSTVPELSIEAQLLRLAFVRMPLNLLMTAAAGLLILALGWLVVDQVKLTVWTIALLLVAASGFALLTAFRRSTPASDALARWRLGFHVHAVFAGAAWSLGPLLVLPQTGGGGSLALGIAVVLSVGGVITIMMAEQRDAMLGFLCAMLLPVVIVTWLGGSTMAELVALALFLGLLALIAVGRRANQTMRNLLITQAQVRAMLNASQDAVIGINTKGRIVDWNARAESVFGLTRSEAQGLAFEDTLVPERHRAAYRANLLTFLSTGRPAGMNRRIETTALRRDGQEFPIEIAITPSQFQRDHRFTAFVTDITARKAAEERLALFRRVFDASSQMISIYDKKGGLLYRNLAHRRQLGYSDAEMQTQGFTRTMTPESVAKFTQEIRLAMQTGESWSGQLTLQRRDGSRFVAINNIDFVKDSAEQIQYAFNIFSDFSQELARRQELASAKEAAEAANQAKSDFLSSMSHELRTPMNAIIGFAQMLEYDDTVTADQQDNVQEILKAGRHLLALINEVLDLARIESGHLNLSLECVPLAPLFDECRQLLQALAAARQISMHFELSAGRVVRADRVRFKQVLLNLLSNAIKYNRVGGEIRLTLAAVAGQRLRVSVEDTGHGIAPERLGELFQPFNRLNLEHSGIEGTGIGLTITRRLIEQMGGAVGVTSQVGIGSTFWIELPAVSVDDVSTVDAALDANADANADTNTTANTDAGIAAVATAETSAVGDDASTDRQRPRRLLYIDDNAVNLKLMLKMLDERADLQLSTADSPGLGLELAMAERPDLILLDIHMPGMDGYQVLQVLQADARLARVPVVAVTANAMPRDIERGIAAGFSAYLTKPLEVENLLRAIDAGLGEAAKTPFEPSEPAGQAIFSESRT